ncbi:head GIN domain-containing protein [Psychroflexus salis]|uniref:Putative auto-transporter adhesin head GIN domain-containing protein n=1 Tax=Psychroflexus salis TaxID=1526574 RepID=A0A916ZUW6_9FLAO|nr:head GIN domain-containing protein [Psychroflexus salis]GGE13829.1 hypothetical protein GCM10010831_14010 [Psychroflexus salis]
MRKPFMFLFILLFSTHIYAQKRIEKIEEDFNKIKVSSNIIANIHINANENKVVIDGLDKTEVDVRFRRDELRVSLPLNHLFSNSDTQIDIYVKSIQEIEATSSAELQIKGLINQNKISMKAVEMASIDAEIDVEKLELYLLTGGSIRLHGKAKVQHVIIKTGAEYYGELLKTKTTNVEISYKGIAEVFASESCTATVIAGGEVSVFGNPASLEETTKLGGIVKRVVVNK